MAQRLHVTNVNNDVLLIGMMKIKRFVSSVWKSIMHTRTFELIRQIKMQRQ